MKNEAATAQVLSNFFADGAKIVFGSMVVGVLIQNGNVPAPTTTIISGSVLTIFFLIVAVHLQKKG
ncbi:MAG: hypothetical protein Q8R39_04185 [bacterium]|nr:hypothetical protein [bacterium]MDZ4284489.1 hypothetical protein [Patescibacteria group bacterium]